MVSRRRMRALGGLGRLDRRRREAASGARRHTVRMLLEGAGVGVYVCVCRVWVLVERQWGRGEHLLPCNKNEDNSRRSCEVLGGNRSPQSQARGDVGRSTWKTSALPINGARDGSVCLRVKKVESLGVEPAHRQGLNVIRHLWSSERKLCHLLNDFIMPCDVEWGSFNCVVEGCVGDEIVPSRISYEAEGFTLNPL